MGLYMRDTQKRSELQEHVAAQLKEKLRSQGDLKTLNDSEQKFIENQHETDSRGIAFVLFIIIAIVITWLFIYTSMQ